MEIEVKFNDLRQLLSSMYNKLTSEQVRGMSVRLTITEENPGEGIMVSSFKIETLHRNEAILNPTHVIGEMLDANSPVRAKITTTKTEDV